MSSCASSPHTVPPKTSTSSTSSTTTSTTTTLPPSTSTTSTLPVGTPVPTGFDPGSVTFVSEDVGYVLGIDSQCAAGSCVALARTSDGGASWVLVPGPIAGYVNRYSSTSSAPPVSEVRFADERNGWVYGPSLFATHDGGATWQEIHVQGSVVDLETSGGYVDALVSPCSTGQQCTGSLHLLQAPATGGPFTTVLTGPSVSSTSSDVSALSLHAPVGFVSLSVVSTPGQVKLSATSNLASGTAWNSFPNPCGASSGSGLDTFVAPDTTDLFTLCSGQGAAGSVEKVVVKTSNGVSHVVGTPPAGGDPEGLAANGSGTLVVSAASGASWLYRSTDGGATWSTALSEDDGGIGFNDLGFTTATQGIAIHGVPGPPSDYSSQLLMTTDGGATWTPVPIS